jgi:hypothetical protein
MLTLTTFATKPSTTKHNTENISFRENQRMDIPETQAILGTQDTERRQNTTQERKLKR